VFTLYCDQEVIMALLAVVMAVQMTVMVVLAGMTVVMAVIFHVGENP